MKINLTLRNLKILNLKKLLFTSEKAFINWKTEFIYVKTFFFKRFLEEFYQSSLNESIFKFKKTLNYKKSTDLILK